MTMATKPTAKDETKTEKEKSKADPAGKPQEPEKVEVLDIPATEPYPTGKGVDADEEFRKIHGYDRPKGG
jgi:hypothetical protein